MNLSDEEVSIFRELGWLRLGSVASPQQVAEVLREERRFRLDRGDGSEYSDTLRVNIQLCHRSEAVRRFCTSGPHLVPDGARGGSVLIGTSWRAMLQSCE